MKTTTPKFRYLRRLLTVIAVCIYWLSNQIVFAGTVYVYQRADGTKLITDRRHSESGLNLIKRYSYRSSSSSASRAPVAVKSKFDALISHVATEYAVDEALIKAVMHAESSFDPYAISHKGAYGLMQLMPDTASRYGVSNLVDPRQNISGGVRYLRDLLVLFDQDKRLALAAYNAGENAVIRYGGIPPYKETKNYVDKVLYLHHLYAKK